MGWSAISGENESLKDESERSEIFGADSARTSPKSEFLLSLFDFASYFSFFFCTLSDTVKVTSSRAPLTGES